MIDGYSQIMIHTSTFQKLKELKEKTGARSIDAVIKNLIGGQ